MKALPVNLTAGGALALVGVAIAGVVLWKLAANGTPGASLAQRVGEGSGRAAGDAATGVVLGAGDALGLPRTSEDACKAALARGDLWEASFACPAGEFLSGTWNKVTTTINGAAIDPAAQPPANQVNGYSLDNVGAMP